jgi:hypothetical protein
MVFEWCHGGGGSDGDSFARTPLHVTSPIFSYGLHSPYILLISIFTIYPIYPCGLSQT